MKTKLPQIHLFFTEGSSDKEYLASIEQAPAGFVVNFSYGRRGGTLKFGTKTASPVSRNEAQNIFDDLVSEKKDKGYTEDPSGTPFSTSAPKTASSFEMPKLIPPNPKKPSTKSDGSRDFAPQLLNPITEEQAEQYIEDDDYMAQEKKNGQRVSVVKKEKTIKGFNKLGIERPLPVPVTSAVSSSFLSFQVDNELIGDVLHVFDVLFIGNKDIRSEPAIRRLEALDFLGFTGKYVKPIQTAFTTAEKRAMFNRLKEQNAEGIVFKLKNAPYTAGRPETGGSQVKCKFYKTASVVVTKVNTKRSVGIGVLGDGGVMVNVGNVTIPPNKPIPHYGQLVEVRYLYAYKGGSLYQPTYLENRTSELELEDCRIGQLIYKSEDD